MEVSEQWNNTGASWLVPSQFNLNDLELGEHGEILTEFANDSTILSNCAEE